MVVVLLFAFTQVMGEYSYKKAVEEWNAGDYTSAASRFFGNGNRHDAEEYIAQYREMVNQAL